MNKTCTKCKTNKPLVEFYKSSATKDGYMYKCKVCRSKLTFSHRQQYKITHKDYLRIVEKHWRLKYKLTKFWNITLEDYNAMLISQNWCCYLCKKSLINRKQCIDHDHNCSCGYRTNNFKSRCCGDCIRGILCNDCNIMLGMSRDNIKVLSSAINYIKNGGIWS